MKHIFLMPDKTFEIWDFHDLYELSKAYLDRKPDMVLFVDEEGTVQCAEPISYVLAKRLKEEKGI